MRNRTLALVLVLAAALALAGCNGGPAGPTTTAPNATTAEATNATATATPADTTPAPNENVDFPPGVTSAGLENRTALFAADWEALNESGFVAVSQSNRSASGAQGNGVSITRRARVSAGGQNATLQVEQQAATGTVVTDVWQNTTFGLTRIVENAPDSASSTYYRQRDDVSSFRTNPITSGTPASLVALGNYDTVSVAGTGTDTRITLTADGVNESRISQIPVNVTAYNGEIVVDRTGRIRSMDVTLETSGRRAATYTLDYDLERTGNVTIERPDWFETGLTAAPNVNVSAEIVNESYVALTNEGPDPLEAGWQVQLQTRFRPVTANLSAPVESGETVYLSIPADGQQLQVTRTAPTNGTSQLSGISGVTVVEVSETTGQTYPVAGTRLNAAQGSGR